MAVLSNIATTTASLLLLLLPLTLQQQHIPFVAAATPRASMRATADGFVASSCGNTTYPAVCVAALSPYSRAIMGDPLQLVRTAISVSLDGARSFLALAKKLDADGALSGAEAGAVRDCTEAMGDSLSKLQQSLDAMGGHGLAGQWVRMDNVQTWMSAALTDENMCTEGFSGDGGNVMRAARQHAVRVTQLTSNALALVGSLGTVSVSP